MPKKKKGPFGKKGGRFQKGPGSFAPTPAANAPGGITNHAGNNRRQAFNRHADVDMNAPTREQSSMMQQALNTRKNTSHWDQATRLREKPIVFISAGFIEPSKDIQSRKELNIDKLAENEVQLDLAATSSPKSVSSLQPGAAGATASGDSAQVQTHEAAAKDDVDIGSDSSEEVILFKGRGAVKDVQPMAVRPTADELLPDMHPDNMSEPAVRVREPTPTPTREAAPAAVISTVPESTPPPPSGPDHDRLGLLIIDSDDEGGSDAAINDYIENMAADEISDMVRYLGGNRRTLGGSHDDIVVDETEPSEEDAVEDEDVAAEESEETCIRWDAENNDIGGESSDSDSDQQNDDWPLAEDIDDEELARLLAKQEELGLGSEELILLDDAAIGARKGANAGRDAKSRQRKRSKAPAPWKEFMTGGLRGPNGSFPSAETVADAFDQLELMGRQGGGFDFELSDSDLEATLKASWQKDRARKKEKKKAREEQRAQGLLGKYANPDDPRIKYASGMEFEDLKAEFRSFLLGSENSVALPPMDAHARKIIHELAYRFNITSKSIGSGDQRRPSLVRKKGTVHFDEGQFTAVFAKYRRRFFPRLDSKRGGGDGPSKSAGGRGAGGGAAMVRNGEVVGGSAPEIGQANKGRAMLEKMGWSMGMALGAMNNKGMTQPIEHVVKRSKAGLG